MGRHVIRSFDSVTVQAIVFRSDPAEEVIEIRDHVRVCVLLYRQRCGRVLKKNCEQSGRQPARIEPSLDFASELVQPFAACRYTDPRGVLNHSTVTLFARLRG